MGLFGFESEDDNEDYGEQEKEEEGEEKEEAAAAALEGGGGGSGAWVVRLVVARGRWEWAIVTAVEPRLCLCFRPGMRLFLRHFWSLFRPPVRPSVRPSASLYVFFSFKLQLRFACSRRRGTGIGKGREGQ